MAYKYQEKLIKKDIQKWNEWRRENLSKKIDLQGANLRLANLQYADLQGANLQYADLRVANLRRAKLQGANLQYADLRRAKLQGADLHGAIWDFSCLPLWCGSFDKIVDDRFIAQIVCDIKRSKVKG